jgi:hypothetical protein
MQELFEIADKEDIEIVYGSFPLTQSLSMPGYVALDYSLLWDTPAERVHAAHELGHCCTGAFYNRYAPHDLRGRHEAKAVKWSIQKLIPEASLKEAVAAGLTETWELAEHFCVTEDFIRQAVCWYQRHNIYQIF